MISAKLRAVRTFIDLCQASKGGMSKAECLIVLGNLADAHEQALALEGAQVPRRQRLTDDHLSGNVTLFPLIPRDHSALP